MNIIKFDQIQLCYIQLLKAFTLFNNLLKRLETRYWVANEPLKICLDLLFVGVYEEINCWGNQYVTSTPGGIGPASSQN